MKHAFSADESAFASLQSSQDYLADSFTRNQALIIKRAVEHAWDIRDESTGYPEALHVAAQLKSMRADMPILVSALLGTDVSSERFPIDYVHEHFGQEIATLTASVRWLNELTINTYSSGTQAETLRRMVLSMVEDVRVVLVKLAYRTQRLYTLVKTDSESAKSIAQETLAIYAPLANRLGLGQLKWELEDVAFRIVEPEAYKRVAKALEENRASRETYIKDFVSDLDSRINTHGIVNCHVFGRPKHIYSIWRKMNAKGIEFADLFDVRAVRVLVDDLQQCYSVLGVAHSIWQPISREFDDYIANPKDNGYRSLHTAVIGPNGKPVEIQIRTRAMDDHAENGVAAHWAYKEGSVVDTNLQHSINALRQLLEEHDDDEQLIDGFSQQLDSQRVYVFTPKGEVIDLANGATPLDFAYHIHSEIGHRCRGAKANGRIVPLTYILCNGDKVEVLTTREPGPSRDWLNKSLGYVNGSRARSKVRAWFNHQDYEQHLTDGRAIVDRELKRFKTNSIGIAALAKRLKFDKLNDLFVAVGRNDVTVGQIAGAIDHLLERSDRTPGTIATPVVRERRAGGVSVRGIGNLLTQIAPCCTAVPPDNIVGFITRSKGVTIHRADCSNILNLRDSEQERLIEVDWGEDVGDRYNVEIYIKAIDRHGLLRDVSTMLSSLDIDVVSLNTLSNKEMQTADMTVGLQISHTDELTLAMDKIRQLRNVQDVERIS